MSRTASGGSTESRFRTTANLVPGDFDVVMATGIVSVAAFLLGHRDLSRALLAIACALWVVLLALSALRWVRHRDAVRADIHDARKVFGYFTFVAGTGVLAARFALAGQASTTLALWVIAVAAWLVVTYGLLWLLTAREIATDPMGVAGNWLLAAVATQSVAIGAADLSRWWAAHQLLFASFCLWMIGLGMYGVIVVFVVTRLLFRPMRPADLTPDFWIGMGAVAISTLAGSLLTVSEVRSPVLSAVHPLVEGLAVASWAIGAWWIPYLVVIEAWQIVRRGVLSAYYHPRRWAMVFPLGMFTAATFHLGGAVRLSELRNLASYLFWVALAAWAATVIQALWAIVKGRGVSEVA